MAKPSSDCRGEVEVKKSSIAIMSWIQKGGKEVMATIEEAQGTFELKSVRDPSIRHTIKRLERNHGERILGVRISLDGNDEHEFKFRL